MIFFNIALLSLTDIKTRKNAILTDDTILAYSQKASPVYPSVDYHLDVWNSESKKLISIRRGITEIKLFSLIITL